MKIHKKFTDREGKNCNCQLRFLVVASIILLVSLVAILFLLFNCSEIRELLKGKELKHKYFDDDELKLQFYLLESDYYFDQIDKEENKIASVEQDYRAAKKYGQKVEPLCVNKTSPAENVMSKLQNLQEMAENSIKYFKQILTNWGENIDYMDIDSTLHHLLKEYHDIFFNPGDWKEEKVDNRLKQLKDFYGSAIQQLEKCTIPRNIHQEDLDKLQDIREQISITENELDEKSNKFNKLNEELIRRINKILIINIQCLYDFPEKWLLIQHEAALAEREIEVIRLKLKQVRYKLMMADSPEKLDSLAEWQAGFSNTKSSRFAFYIDSRYAKACKLQHDLLESIKKCTE